MTRRIPVEKVLQPSVIFYKFALFILVKHKIVESRIRIYS